MGKAKRSDSESSSSSSSSESSSSSSSSEEEKVQIKKVDEVKSKKVDVKKNAKESDSSSESSSSDSSSSDSEDDTPAPVTAKNGKGSKSAPAKKASSESESDSSSDSDSESEDEKPASKQKTAPVETKKAAVASKKESDSSSSSESESEKEKEEEKPKSKTKKEVESEPIPAASSDDKGDEKQEYAYLFQGLPFSAGEEEVKSFLQGVKVKEIKFDSNKKGMAVVYFPDAQQKAKAFEFDGQYMGERYVKMRDFDANRSKFGTGGESGRAQPGDAPPEGCTTIFCGNLSFEIDEETIKDFFKDCGAVKQVRWGMDKETDTFKGFGFVEFYSADAVKEAIKLQGQPLLNRDIRLDFSAPRNNAGGDKGPRKSFGDRSNGGDRGGFKRKSFGGPSGGDRGGSAFKKGKPTNDFKGKKITFD